MSARDANSRTYKTVPMPTAIRGGRLMGQSRAERVAAAMADVINKEAAQGWSYLGSDTVRTQERQGLFGGMREAVYTVLVFERVAQSRVEPSIAEAPVDAGRAAAPSPRTRQKGAGLGAPPREPRRGYGFDEELTAERDDDTDRRPLRRREARVAARRAQGDDWEEETRREPRREDANGAGRSARGLVETMRQHRDRQ